MATSLSLQITGKAYWRLLEEDGRRKIIYLPATWVTPVHKDKKFNAFWMIDVPGSTDEPYPVPGDQIAYFHHPDPADPFRFGPHAVMLGESPIVAGFSPLTAEVLTAGRLVSVSLKDDYLPAHVIGELLGSDSPVELAVGLNGRLAGFGTTFFKDVWRISVMVDPEALKEGYNDLKLYEIRASGLFDVKLGESGP